MNTCPFDAWKGNENSALRGGEIVKVTDHRFVYRYPGETPGSIRRVLVGGKEHGGDLATLLFQYSDEMALLVPVAIKALGPVEAFTMYFSEGDASGGLVKGHPHINFIPRRAGEPASGKGVELLVNDFNALSRAYDKMAWSSGT